MGTHLQQWLTLLWLALRIILLTWTQVATGISSDGHHQFVFQSCILFNNTDQSSQRYDSLDHSDKHKPSTLHMSPQNISSWHSEHTVDSSRIKGSYDVVAFHHSHQRCRTGMPQLHRSSVPVPSSLSPSPAVYLNSAKLAYLTSARSKSCVAWTLSRQDPSQQKASHMLPS